MSMSLRDQLLQAGLVNEKQAKEAERQALRQAAELGDTDLAEAVRRLLTEERNRQ